MGDQRGRGGKIKYKNIDGKRYRERGGKAIRGKEKKKGEEFQETLTDRVKSLTGNKCVCTASVEVCVGEKRRKEGQGAMRR